MEDNALAHQTVQRVNVERRDAIGLKTLDWPSNSPELNKIEQCWDPMKDEISTYKFVCASIETVTPAKVRSLRPCAATAKEAGWPSAVTSGRE